ncbi:MBL fold metallo-hydrolase [Candidatus Woesearchaeota archaeon]|nr:MBL fold metallo-hydrolase [Candidatus Woesearchaeota archaeon]MBL7051225.1 MBL fold metallo-hydrolase [Candidatus Woesearchaeota archaeon]
MEYNNITLDWLGHAGFRIKSNEKIIYIDPFKINSTEPADFILITHEHYDHCSREDIEKIVNKNTVIITTPDCQSKLSNLNIKGVTTMTPGNKIKVNGMMIEAVPAYNTNKQFHPKENEWLGFILTINNTKIYHAGDTDIIPEMLALKNIDISLIPVSGTYVMTSQEAAQAVNTFKPKLAIPMHYNAIVGTLEDANNFKGLCTTNVKILEKS